MKKMAHAWFIKRRLATFFANHKAALEAGLVRQGGW